MFVRSRRGLLLRLSGPYTQADGHGFHPAPIARAGDRSSITIIETSCNANIMLVGTNAIGGIERHPAQPRHIRFGPGVRRPLQDRKSLVEGKSVSVRVSYGGRRILKKKKNIKNTHIKK